MGLYPMPDIGRVSMTWKTPALRGSLDRVSATALAENWDLVGQMLGRGRGLSYPSGKGRSWPAMVEAPTNGGSVGASALAQ
jgi:hypothetical protein